MNNRLKFRVWSVNDRRFIKSIYHDHADCYIFINAMYGNPVILSKYGDEVELDEKDYVIQQYTGLNDKDNNPIFEGDLVELHTAANDHAKNVKDNHYGLYEIYWDRKYKLKEIKPNWFFKVVDNNCASFNIMKVVGNVFEHSNLLK
jgi:uncharacterized phage protein (TIGR01671 family)